MQSDFGGVGLAISLHCSVSPVVSAVIVTMFRTTWCLHSSLKCSASSPKFHLRLPYFCDVLGELSVVTPCHTHTHPTFFLVVRGSLVRCRRIIVIAVSTYTNAVSLLKESDWKGIEHRTGKCISVRTDNVAVHSEVKVQRAGECPAA